MSAKPKPSKAPPQTPSEWAATRVRLACSIGRDVISGVTTPSRLNRTEYAMFVLFQAVSELADLIELSAKDTRTREKD